MEEAREGRLVLQLELLQLPSAIARRRVAAVLQLRALLLRSNSSLLVAVHLHRRYTRPPRLVLLYFILLATYDRGCFEAATNRSSI